MEERNQKIMLGALVIILFYGLSVVDTVQTQSITTTVTEKVGGVTSKVVSKGAIGWLASIPLLGGVLTSIFKSIGAIFIGFAVYKNSTIIIVLGIIISLIYLIKMLKK